MEYMKKRFEEYETEIYDEDLSSEYSGDLLQKKRISIADLLNILCSKHQIFYVESQWYYKKS
ncbi:hypothetical protein [Bacillus anthracis]|uniref:hypothetical protein n=1 Tax=Bacillus anthracis TaxID=1392 RepID=UPI003D750EEC